MTYEAILAQALAMNKNADTNNTMLINARIMAFAMDHCEIFVPEDATFFVTTNIAVPSARILCTRHCGEGVSVTVDGVSENVRPEAAREFFKTNILTK